MATALRTTGAARALGTRHSGATMLFESNGRPMLPGMATNAQLPSLGWGFVLLVSAVILGALLSSFFLL
jgi:hypothetical protein